MLNSNDALDVIIPAAVSLAVVLFQEKGIVERSQRNIMTAQKQKTDQLDIKFEQQRLAMERLQNYVESLRDEVGGIKERLARLEQKIDSWMERIGINKT